MSQYKLGKPIYKFERRVFVTILVALAVILGGGYYWLVLKNSNGDKITNNNRPLVSTVKAADVNTPVDEPDFSLTLPGKWALSAHNWDARYISWQWKLQDSRYAGRMFEVYQDRLPTDYPYNYLLPVTANGDTLELGQISGNCTDFTTTAPSRNSAGNTISLSKWQQVSFYCDYGSISQVVGTSSLEGVNQVTLTGAAGSHKYFFIYRDNNYSPDFGVMASILGTFKAK